MFYECNNFGSNFIKFWKKRGLLVIVHSFSKAMKKSIFEGQKYLNLFYNIYKKGNIHMDPTGFQKTKESMAAQTFRQKKIDRWSTRYWRFYWKINQLFGTLNSYESSTIQKILLSKYENYFDKIKSKKNGNDSSQKIKCFKSWVRTINCLLQLLYDEEKDYFTRRFSSDPIENCFGIQNSIYIRVYSLCRKSKMYGQSIIYLYRTIIYNESFKGSISGL